MSLNEYFAKRHEILEDFYADRITIKQAKEQINSLVSEVTEIKLTEITEGQLRDNKSVIAESMVTK